jgi:hypothetical protein
MRHPDDESPTQVGAAEGAQERGGSANADATPKGDGPLRPADEEAEIEERLRYLGYIE